jgi:hypothetical protein
MNRFNDLKAIDPLLANKVMLLDDHRYNGTDINSLEALTQIGRKYISDIKVLQDATESIINTSKNLRELGLHVESLQNNQALKGVTNKFLVTLADYYVIYQQVRVIKGRLPAAPPYTYKDLRSSRTAINYTFKEFK